ncbi:MAG: NADH-quinone oxidoreductase subunit H [Gemmatimonadales bacterium]|nr:NADH-quinone oxidoreductase subunit H [Gemmatimonadales bacterium]
MKATDDLSESVGLSIAALVLASVIPMATTGPFADLPYGLFVLVAGYAGVALTLAVTGTAGDDWMAAAERPGGAIVWAGCWVAMVLAIAAVVVTAQTMDLRNGVLAQENTLPYLLLQPVAALGFVLALAVAVSHGVRPPMGDAPGARRLAEGLHLLVGCAVGGTLFLGGYSGPFLSGPVWLLAKAGALMLAVLALSRRLSGLPDERRRGLAWRVLAPAALLNLIATFVAVGRPR